MSFSENCSLEGHVVNKASIVNYSQLTEERMQSLKVHIQGKSNYNCCFLSQMEALHQDQ